MSSATKKSKKPGSSKEKEEDFEPGSWECTVCTYRNTFEAFKCDMCDTRKGTSTRKPRLNFNVVQQQTLVQNLAVQNERALKKQRNSDTRSRYSPESNFSAATSSRLLNGAGSSAAAAGTAHLASRAHCDSPSSMRIDTRLLKRRMIPFPDSVVVRASPTKHSITLNDATFSITEFRPRHSSSGNANRRKAAEKNAGE